MEEARGGASDGRAAGWRWLRAARGRAESREQRAEERRGRQASWRRRSVPKPKVMVSWDRAGLG